MALKVTVPSLLSGMFMPTNRCGHNENTNYIYEPPKLQMLIDIYHFFSFFFGMILSLERNRVRSNTSSMHSDFDLEMNCCISLKNWLGFFDSTLSVFLNAVMNYR